MLRELMLSGFASKVGIPRAVMKFADGPSLWCEHFCVPTYAASSKYRGCTLRDFHTGDDLKSLCVAAGHFARLTSDFAFHRIRQLNLTHNVGTDAEEILHNAGDRTMCLECVAGGPVLLNVEITLSGGTEEVEFLCWDESSLRGRSICMRKELGKEWGRRGRGEKRLMNEVCRLVRVWLGGGQWEGHVTYVLSVWHTGVPGSPRDGIRVPDDVPDNLGPCTWYIRDTKVRAAVRFQVMPPTQSPACVFPAGWFHGILGQLCTSTRRRAMLCQTD